MNDDDISKSARIYCQSVAKDLIKMLRQGCGDNSCYFGKKGGMKTNGHCRCHEKVEDILSTTVIYARKEGILAAKQHVLSIAKNAANESIRLKEDGDDQSSDYEEICAIALRHAVEAL